MHACAGGMRIHTAHNSGQLNQSCSALGRLRTACDHPHSPHGCHDPVRAAPGLQPVLRPEELSWLLSTVNRPIAVAGVVSSVLRHAGIDTVQRSALDTCVSEWLGQLGSCERILKTPIPAAYSRWVLLAVRSMLHTHGRHTCHW